MKSASKTIILNFYGEPETICSTIYDGKFDLLKQFVKQGEDINTFESYYGETPLTLAIKVKRPDIYCGWMQ